MFLVSRDLHIVFYRGSANFHSCQQRQRVPFPPHPGGGSICIKPEANSCASYPCPGPRSGNRRLGVKMTPFTVIQGILFSTLKTIGLVSLEILSDQEMLLQRNTVMGLLN